MSQPSPLVAAQRHAWSAQAAGDLVAARGILETALDQARGVLGDDDPAVLATAHQLAAVYRAAGDPAGARRELEEAYAAGQWRLGDTDPLLLAISFDLGVVAEELGNRHEARRAFGRVAGYGPRVLGEDHTWVRQARSYLGGDAPTVQLELPELAGGPAAALAGPAFPPPETTRSPAAAPAARAPAAAPESVPGGATGATSQVRPAPPAEPARQAGVTALARPVEPAPGVWAVSGPAVDPSPLDHGSGWAGAVPAPAAPGMAVRPVTAPQPPPGIAAGPWAGPAHMPGYRTRPPGRSATPVIVAASVVAVMMTLVAVIAVMGRWSVVDETGTAPDDVPGVAGPPPTDVRLRDSGSLIVVTWGDPTAGVVSFIVSGARAGEQQRAMGHVDPGRTRYELNGLNPDLDYCFAVVAVYGVDRFASSPQVCTSRDRSRPRSTTT